MDVTPLIAPGQKIIHGYGKGFFRINGEIYREPVIVCPEDICLWDGHDFSGRIIGIAPEILLFGYGASSPSFMKGDKGGSSFDIPALKKSLKQHGIVLDAMDTGAACRTYNVLMAEGRSVAAALLPF